VAAPIDEISPAYVGAQSIKLTFATTDAPRAFNAVDINLAIQPGATKAVEVGLSLPLELTITSPSNTNFKRHIYRRTVPSTITFTPREGGAHLVRISEVGHNRWWGSLIVSVAGERVNPE
jgi:hypothetical protein